MSEERKIIFVSNEKDLDLIEENIENYVFCVVERVTTSKNSNVIRNEYLVSRSTTFKQFNEMVADHMKLSVNEHIMLNVNNIVPTANKPIAEIYEKHQNEFGFLLFKATVTILVKVPYEHESHRFVESF